MNRDIESHEEAAQRVWARIAREHPNFTRDHDPVNNPWMVEDHVLNNEQGFSPFLGAKVLDIGANVGVVSAYWALNGANVTAYEADPETYKILIRMLEKTHLSSKIKAVNAAVWTHTGTVEFKGIGHQSPRGFYHRNGCMYIPSGDGFQRNSYFSQHSQSVLFKVPCISFAEVLGDTVWDFVKFDIEGAEIEVLSNIDLGILKRQVKAMQVEYHNDWGTSEQRDKMVARLNTVFKAENGHWAQKD
jgi:FkbM family methyltransferase